VLLNMSYQLHDQDVDGSVKQREEAY
jgi:hypothetical protein